MTELEQLKARNTQLEEALKVARLFIEDQRCEYKEGTIGYTDCSDAITKINEVLGE